MGAKNLKIHASDKVELALLNLPKGEKLDTCASSFTLLNDVASSHKYAQPSGSGGPGGEDYSQYLFISKAERCH